MIGSHPNIAFVQDALPFQAGAEKVLAAALDVFPQAPVYTMVYHPEAFRGSVFEGHPIQSTFINKLPGARRNYRLYLPLMPLALETFDFTEFDIVISFSYAVAHAAYTRPDQLHISYIHTPLRYAWNEGFISQGASGFNRLAASVLRPVLNVFRRWDRAMISRTDHFLANSRWTAGKIRRIYQRNADVLYPPVDTGRFTPGFPRAEYYIAVSRLVRHKRLDILLEAFSRLKRPLVVIGEGPLSASLQRRATPNIHFLGWQPAERMAVLLGRAKAFVHAGEEDFGIAMAEAQAAGCPVIALGRGGACEIVSDGSTGMLFQEQSSERLVEAVEQFERHGVECGPEGIRASVQRFNRQRFVDGFESYIQEKWEAQVATGRDFWAGDRLLHRMGAITEVISTRNP